MKGATERLVHNKPQHGGIVTNEQRLQEWELRKALAPILERRGQKLKPTFIQRVA